MLLSESLSTSLRQFSAQEGVTLFMTLLTAFKTLLYRYTGQEDIVIGCPIANRNRSETEKLIGFFVNSLIVRTDVSGAPSFRELLRRIRRVTLEAFAHQDIPFESIVEALQPERDLKSPPWFRIMFALQNAPSSALNLSNVSLTGYKADKGTTVLDIFLALTEVKQGIVARLSYNSDIFEPGTIAQMLTRYRLILERAVIEPDVGLLNIPLVSEAEESSEPFDGIERKYGLEQFNF